MKPKKIKKNKKIKKLCSLLVYIEQNRKRYFILSIWKYYTFKLNLTGYFLLIFLSDKKGQGEYPDLSDSTTKKKHFFMCFFPKYGFFFYKYRLNILIWENYPRLLESSLKETNA